MNETARRFLVERIARLEEMADFHAENGESARNMMDRDLTEADRLRSEAQDLREALMEPKS